jgi:hypothetical protein
MILLYKEKPKMQINRMPYLYCDQWPDIIPAVTYAYWAWEYVAGNIVEANDNE